MVVSLLKKVSNSSFLALIFSPVIYSFAIPLAITLWILNESLRTGVRVLLWLKYGPTLNLVNDSRDAIFNYKSSGNSRNVLVVGITKKTTVDTSKCAKIFERQVLFHEETVERGVTLLGSKKYRPYEKLEKIMVTSLGYACWKGDEHFDVQEHFRALPDDGLYTEQDLMELLSTLSEDMDESKPQWEWIFIPRYQDATGQEKSVQIFRYHHAYMDELALQLLLSIQLGNGTTSLQFNPTEVRPEAWKKLVMYINTALYGPFVLLMMLLSKFNTHWVPSGVRASEKKNNFVTSAPISIKVFEQIRAQTSASIPNTVAKAFITSVKKVIPQERLLEFIRINEIMAMLPFNNSNPQNRFSVFAYDISTDEQQDNPQDFYESVSTLRRDRLGGMAGPQHLLFFHVLSYLFTLPSFLLKYVADGVYSSILLRNIPSFPDKVAIFDREVEELSIHPPVSDRAGISLASTSYAGYLKLTAAADSTWLTQEELQRVFIEMPKVIYAIAVKGYIPSELPQLHMPSRNIITPIPEMPLQESAEEIDTFGSSASSALSDSDSEMRSLDAEENDVDADEIVDDDFVPENDENVAGHESDEHAFERNGNGESDEPDFEVRKRDDDSQDTSEVEKTDEEVPIKAPSGIPIKSVNGGWANGSFKNKNGKSKKNKTGHMKVQNGRH